MDLERKEKFDEVMKRQSKACQQRKNKYRGDNIYWDFVDVLNGDQELSANVMSDYIRRYTPHMQQEKTPKQIMEHQKEGYYSKQNQSRKEQSLINL